MEKLSRDGPNERIRELARQTAEKIRSQDNGGTAPTAAEVKQLREKVERLEREQAEMREQLRKLEKKAKE